jgi:xanthine dehydrogenase iron-sulfur cluster and FAD-binding subunit A
MAAVALLKRTSNPTDEEIDAIENVCRCGSYFRIREAIKSAAKKLAATGGAAAVAPDVQPETATLPTTGLGTTAAVTGAAAVAAAAAARVLRDDPSVAGA